MVGIHYEHESKWRREQRRTYYLPTLELGNNGFLGFEKNNPVNYRKASMKYFCSIKDY